MKKAGIIVGCVLGVVVLWVAIVAALVGSEASKMDSAMKDAVSKHSDLATVKQQLSLAGYEVTSSTPTDLEANGSKRWALFYGTWLTLKVTLNQEQKATAYHLDRDSCWF